MILHLLISIKIFVENSSTGQKNVWWFLIQFRYNTQYKSFVVTEKRYNISMSADTVSHCVCFTIAHGVQQMKEEPMSLILLVTCYFK
jgi:hypothetical protein